MKSKIVALSAAALAFGALSACVHSTKEYESNPIQVQTSRGVVTCQLYRLDIVEWDRSTDRPARMGIEEADQYCIKAGQMIKAGEV